MSVTVNIRYAKTHFSRLIERAEKGEETVIARAGRPVARLVPLAEAKPKRRLGLFRGQIRIADDFDDLPDDIKTAFGGET
ncbi:MAG: type II toxin-antitoxin system Phd/YefM family antitoxin [Alphaproteobacteria bacterium]|nr:type II toxin-antitoxin system Phd/YefM family antitoxin [Alphaproteobacteria bacterium]